MSRLVMKFGGTSVADIDRIRNVARHVKREVDAGHQVAVVVSAMAGTTNQLVNWTNDILKTRKYPDPREYDVVVSTGEQITTGLLALALQDIGIPARSWMSWQIPVRTDDAFAKARIEAIRGDEMIADMNKGVVAVVPGFQGVTAEGRVTTLGRGGSDTTGVALAAALKADECQIYTDVDGVYTTDPRICPDALKLDRVSHEEMLESASQGAKVLQVRSVAVVDQGGLGCRAITHRHPAGPDELVAVDPGPHG